MAVTPNRVRVNYTLPEALVDQLRVVAAVQKTSASRIVEQLISVFLAANQQRKAGRRA